MTKAIDLLRPWIRRQFGDEVDNPAERLDAFRALIPGELPADYADTLLHIGRSAGLVGDTIIQAIEKAPPRNPRQFTYMGDTPSFNRLYGLQSNLWNIFETWDALRDRMPPGLVPIGEDFFGNQICIDVSEAGNGRIYSWFHEGDPGPPDAQGRPGWANTFLLATSFTDLLHRLRKDDPLPDDAPIGRICSVRP
jgi:hypothetical protein